MKAAKASKKIDEAKSSQRNPQSLRLGDQSDRPYRIANKCSLQHPISANEPAVSTHSAGGAARKGKMDPAMRRRVMASIRNTDTVPELTLRRALYAVGLRGWRCHAKILGKPDIVFNRKRVAVFVDGVWWHGHPDWLPNGHRGPYWDAKIAGNAARDARVTTTLTSMGWKVLRVWDQDVLKDAGRAVQAVIECLEPTPFGRPILRSPIEYDDLKHS